jgi:hypothetical protein
VVDLTCFAISFGRIFGRIFGRFITLAIYLVIKAYWYPIVPKRRTFGRLFGRIVDWVEIGVRANLFRNAHLQDGFAPSGAPRPSRRLSTCRPFDSFAWYYDPEGNKIELWQPGEEG